MTDIRIPLDLPDVKVISVEGRAQGGWTITVESTLASTHCRKCGRRIREFHGHDDWVEVRHLPIFDQAVFIRYQPKRYRCPYCEGGPTTTQGLRWQVPPSPFTRAYEDHLLKALIHSTVQDVSQKEGVGYDAVVGVLDHRVHTTVDWSRFTRLAVIGIDELAVKKGQGDYAVLVSARLSGDELALLAVLPDRKTETVQTFLNSIPERLKATIHTVCVDMYENYLQAAQAALPQADIVVDRFHVVKLYSEAVDKVRRQGLARLKKTLPKADYQTLKGSHVVFRKHRANLDPEEQALLNRLFAYLPQLRLLYDFREYLFVIFQTAASSQRAEAELKAWIFLVKEQALDAFFPFLETLQRYWSFILNFFKRRLTSGFVEGFNHKVRVLLWRSFGLFKLDRLFQRLWLDLVGPRVFRYTH
jgi:transposase